MDQSYRLLAEGFTAQVFDWKPGEVLKLYRLPFAAVAEREHGIMQMDAWEVVRAAELICLKAPFGDGLNRFVADRT